MSSLWNEMSVKYRWHTVCLFDEELCSSIWYLFREAAFMGGEL